MKNVTEKRVYTEDEKLMFLYGNLFENYYRTGSTDWVNVSKYGNLQKPLLASFKKAGYISSFEITYPDMLAVLAGADAEFVVKVFDFDVNTLNRIPKHWIDFMLYIKHKVDKETKESSKEHFSVENTLKKNDKYRMELQVPTEKNVEVIAFEDRCLSDFPIEGDEQEVLKQLACETDVYQNKGKKISTKKRA